MNETKKAKIARFLQDEVMSSAVYDVLVRSFLVVKAGEDIHILAASRLAFDFLERGWKELQKNAISPEKETKDTDNPGV